jgi:uncharacterized CHY-type Zn-finger protein
MKLGPLPLLMGFAFLAFFLLSDDLVSAFDRGIQQSDSKGQEDIRVPPPPLNEDYYPCSMCHEDLETNPERRLLEEMHDDIEFKHDEENRWCLDCHDTANRDMLHSAGGELIDFKESYKLCGQCHGPKLRDWKAGIHGRRTGNWNGQKQYLLCAHCHDPHSPKYKSMKPEPPPKKPGKIR